MSDCDIDVELVELEAIDVELVEDGAIEVELMETGPRGPVGPAGAPGLVQSVVAGTNVTVDSTDPANPIVSAAGGSGSGITRLVVVTSGDFTMGASPSIDYTYLVSGAHDGTLPTAIGNTNRYTVKNDHSGDITIDTVGGQTIDGDASIGIAPEDSVDVISDGNNWRII